MSPEDGHIVEDLDLLGLINNDRDEDLTQSSDFLLQVREKIWNV